MTVMLPCCDGEIKLHIKDERLSRPEPTQVMDLSGVATEVLY